MMISDFARLGQVSVRMLRHYDEVGLLVPDAVDPVTGYRSYAPEQLHVLNRLVALKDLGFTLDQVRPILAEELEAEELRGLLARRRAELEEEARAVGIRLMAVESRIRMIEQENSMSSHAPDYVTKSLPAQRLVAQTATLDPDKLSDHIGPMFDSVAAALAHDPGAVAAGALATSLATYSITEQGMDVAVGFVYAGPAPAGTEVVELPAAEAICGVHLGTMLTIGESWQAMHRWIVEQGYEFAGPCREVYLRAESEDQADWVTELQQPVVRQP